MPTALDLTREEWESYLEAARRRASAGPATPELTTSEQRDRERLMGRIRPAAAALRARFGVRRVILSGSLAHAAWFVPDSDVDLAVEGLVGDDYWRAWRLVEEIVGHRSVDLIEIETARESVREAMRRHGIVL